MRSRNRSRGKQRLAEEIVASRGTSGSRSAGRGLIAILCLMPGWLWANPTGGSVAAGTARIAGQGTGAVTITQASNTAIINWQSFSINSGESTSFLQPSATSAVLNRVLGGQTSLINGTLSANGQVYLVNGNGIIVGPGGLINANAFTASTRDITNANFLAGDLHFVGSNSAGVQNFGTIDALGGDVVLIGKTVANGGTISAPNGTAGLVAGDDVLLGQKNADGSTITVSPTATATSASGQVGVSNGGTIAAAAAELKAANGNIYALAVQNEGTIRATTVRRQGGHIWLTSDSGAVSNSGTLDASATAAGGHGGTVTLKSTTGRASHTGQIIARGGQGGAGGNAEISGADVEFTGEVDLSAPEGVRGTLLLDPATIDIITGGGSDITASTIDPSAIVSALNSSDVDLNGTTSITVDSLVDASSNPSVGNLTLTTPLLNLNAGIRLNGTLSGTANTVNVGANGFVQNGVDAVANFGTVNLAAGATYDLTSEILINKSVSLEGNGAVLDGQGSTRLMEIDSGTVTLDQLTLTGGNGASSIGNGTSFNGYGGALMVYGQNSSSTVGITSSTFDNNSSTGGGAIFSVIISGGSNDISITNSTFTGNSGANGGAFYNYGSLGGNATMLFIQCTITGNSGNGAIYNTLLSNGSASVELVGTILAGNTSPSGESDYVNAGGGTLIDGGYNLYGQNGDTGGFVPGNGGSPDIPLNGSIATVVTPLGNYGGPTPTEALVVGSPAYLAGGLNSDVTTDQRGVTRGSTISIGAWDVDYAPSSLEVNTTSDAVGDVIGGPTISLRDAFYYSNLGLISDPTITFDPVTFAGPQTISLAQGQLLINNSLSVQGPAAGLTIDAGGQSRVMEIDGLAVGDTVNLSNLTLANGTGFSTTGAGAVLNGSGGGLLIFAEDLQASVTLTNCNISGNSASTGNGGGITNDGANDGNATLDLEGCTLSGNSTGNLGGGIYNDSTAGVASLTIDQTTLSGNTAGTGGGIYNDGRAGGTISLVITKSTLSGNVANATTTGGGAIFNDGSSSNGADLFISDSTVVDNSASNGSGGGIYNAGYTSGSAQLSIKSSTLAGNSAAQAGGGIYNDGSGSGNADVTIGDTILAGNTAGGAESDYTDTNDGGESLNSAGYNLYGQSGNDGGFNNNDGEFSGYGTGDTLLFNSLATVLQTDGDGIPVLASNGGPTQTVALVQGSPAIDAGDPAYTGRAADQRGIARGNPDALTDSASDIGAYEAQFISVQADPITIIYGQTPTFTYTVTNGPSNASSLLSGAPALFTGATNVGTYPGDIQVGTLMSTSPIFLLNFTDGDFAITPRSVVVEPYASQGKMYGWPDPVLGYTTAPADATTGLVNGDTLSGAISYNGAGQFTGVGNYPMNLGTLANDNYTISLSSNAPTFAITPRAITVSAIDLTGTPSAYGTTPAFANNGESQTINGDVLGGSVSYTSTDVKSPAGFFNEGTYSYTPLLTGYNTNYTITAYNSAEFTITPKAITVAAIDLTGTPSTYGTTPAFANNGQSTVFAGDVLGGTASYSTTDTLSGAGLLDVGTYSYTPSISGYNSNYNITAYTPAGFTITPKAITVAAIDLTASPSTYGTTPAFANNGQSVVFAGDVLGGSATYTNTDSLSPAGYLNTGSYQYTPSITGANANYTINGYTAAGFQINPGALTYVADPANRPVGAPNPTFTGTVTGFAPGETLASATTGTLTFTSPALPTDLTGYYPINGSGLAANFGNYDFFQAPTNATALTVGTPPPMMATPIQPVATSPSQPNTPVSQAIAQSSSPPSLTNIAPAGPDLAAPLAAVNADINLNLVGANQFIQGNPGDASPSTSASGSVGGDLAQGSAFNPDMDENSHTITPGQTISVAGGAAGNAPLPVAMQAVFDQAVDTQSLDTLATAVSTAISPADSSVTSTGSSPTPGSTAASPTPANTPGGQTAANTAQGQTAANTAAGQTGRNAPAAPTMVAPGQTITLARGAAANIPPPPLVQAQFDQGFSPKSLATLTRALSAATTSATPSGHNPAAGLTMVAPGQTVSLSAGKTVTAPPPAPVQVMFDQGFSPQSQAALSQAAGQ